MSQDLFAEYDTDPDDPDIFYNTPTEFSGVSAGNSSHDSPAQGTVSTVTPTQSQSSVSSVVSASSTASPSQVLYTCKVCKSKLKTLPGFKKHLSRHNITEPAAIEAALAECTLPPVPLLQPAVLQPGPSQPSTSTASASQVTCFHCPDCNKNLLTEGGFLRHRASHRYKDAALRMPKPSDFSFSSLVETMKSIIDEILAEPSYEGISDEKNKFLQEFKMKVECSEWTVFARSLSDKICQLVCERQKKILPLNHYEETQHKMQVFLCQEENMSDLYKKLQSVCSQNLSIVLAKRLVFNISLKLLWEIQSWFARETMLSQQSELSSASVQPQEMSNTEKEAFCRNVADIIREYYKKCLKNSSKTGNWLKRSACLSDKFVDGQHPIASAYLLDKDVWFTGDEDGLVPSDNAVIFFRQVESAAVTSSEEHAIYEVTDKILANNQALDLWFHLTYSYFSENDSLLFMKDLIHAITKRSCLFREKQHNREQENALRASRATFRTHLNYNISGKETAESVT